MNKKYFQKTIKIAVTTATFFLALYPNLAYAISVFDNRSDWEKAVSSYTVTTEDFNSLSGNIAMDAKLPSTLMTKLPFTVNKGQAKSDWAAFDIVFPNEVIAFGFDMLEPLRSPERDAILGNVKFFDKQNNVINHLGVQFTSYDENFVGFFLGKNSGVRRIEYLWCGEWQGADKPLGYCKSEYDQQIIDNFSFVTPKSNQKPVPESNSNLGILVFSIISLGVLRRMRRTVTVKN